MVTSRRLSEVSVMVGGHVKWFDSKKGYGFILGPEGKDVFVHYTNIEGDGFRSLREGEHVQYEVIETDKGLAADHVRVTEPPPPS